MSIGCGDRSHTGTQASTSGPGGSMSVPTQAGRRSLTNDLRCSLRSSSGDVSLAYRPRDQNCWPTGVGFDEIVGDVFGPVQAELGALGRRRHRRRRRARRERRRRGPDHPARGDGRSADRPGGGRCGRRTRHARPRARVVASALPRRVSRAVPRCIGPRRGPQGLPSRCNSHSALALSCSIGAALSGARRCVPSRTRSESRSSVVVARSAESRARALGADAFARSPQDAVDRLRTWSLAALAPLARDRRRYRSSGHSRIAVTASSRPHWKRCRTVKPRSPGSARSWRLLYVVDGALVLDDREVVAEHVAWLRTTGPAHGLARSRWRRPCTRSPPGWTVTSPARATCCATHCEASGALKILGGERAVRNLARP